MKRRAEFETVDKFATCKHCGDNFVAWREGKRWYLVAGHLATNYTPRVKLAPREFHVCLPQQTPAQIDSVFAELWPLLEAARFAVIDHDDAVHRIEAGKSKRFEQPIEWHVGQAKEARGRVAWVRRLLSAYEAEFTRRGGWLRYFLVTNAGGHVHREMTCSTCYPTTRYAWLVDLAACDEAKMVDEYGIKACTICFPDAPTMPGWERSQIAAQHAADASCPGSGDYAAGSGHRYVRCEQCGATVSLTKNGLLRKHKPATTVEVS